MNETPSDDDLIRRGYVPRYEYETLPASEVKAALGFSDKIDSYLTEDATVAELRRLRANGFRWVRTDGDHAIFERTSFQLPTQTQTKP